MKPCEAALGGRETRRDFNTGYSSCAPLALHATAPWWMQPATNPTYDLIAQGLARREVSVLKRSVSAREACHVGVIMFHSINQIMAVISAVCRTGLGLPRGMGAWRSVLGSALSACLAVWATLQYQQYQTAHSNDNNNNDHRIISSATIHVEDKSPEEAATSTTDTNAQQHQQPANGDEGAVQEQNQDIIDLDQALGLGRVLLARGEPEEAALAFRLAAAAAARDSTTPDRHVATAQAKHGLGLALRATGRPHEALQACREAEALDPQLALAFVCVGALLTEAGNAAGAVIALRRAAELQGPETADATGRLGAALVAAGEVDEAIPALMRAMAADTRDPHTAYNLGVAWQSKVGFLFSSWYSLLATRV